MTRKLMTLEEAIVHAHEVASKLSDEKCAHEHEQLACWLSELLALREGHKEN